MNLQDVTLGKAAKVSLVAAALAPFLQQAERHLHDQGLIPGLENARNQFAKIIEDFDTAKDEVNADMDLTVQAKARRVKELADIAKDRIEDVRDMSQRLSQIESKIFAPGEQKSEIMQLRDEIRHQEIRKHYWDRTELDLVPTLLESIEDGDDAFIDAILDSPVPMVSKAQSLEIKEKRAIKRLETEAPALLEEYEDVKLVCGLVTGMRNTAADYVRI